MHRLVATRLAEIAALCRASGVRRLDLVGSAARDDFDETRSDLDFVVALAPDPQVSPLDAYFSLKEALEALLDRRVDLISEGSVANPFVKAAMDRDRAPVYAA